MFAAPAVEAVPAEAVAGARPGDVLCDLVGASPSGRLKLVDDAGGRVALRGRRVVAGRTAIAPGRLAFSVRSGSGPVAPLALAVSAPPKTTAHLDRGLLKREPAFKEEFDAVPSAALGKSGGPWKTNFWFGDQAADTSRTLGPINKSGNHEAQVYVDPAYKGLGLQPFSVRDGVLTISADRTPSAMAGRLSDIPYTSGLLTTEKSFAFTTGYVEIRARLPVGKGLWAAPLWLLPVPTRDGHGELRVPGEQEIDGLEVLMHEPGKAFLTLHDKEGGQHIEALAPDTASVWRTYGILKTTTAIAWFIDGAEVYRLPIPADMKGLAMYPLIDLAVGGEGSWSGQPDGATRFPARMEIDYLRAYALR